MAGLHRVWSEVIAWRSLVVCLMATSVAAAASCSNSMDNNKLDYVTGWMLTGVVVLVTMMFYLVKYPDKDIQRLLGLT